LLQTEAIIQSRDNQNCRISENKIEYKKYQFVNIVKKTRKQSTKYKFNK